MSACHLFSTSHKFFIDVFYQKMKKTTLFIVFVILSALSLQAQTGFDVPNKMQFVGLNLRLCDKVRENVEKEVGSLTQNSKYFRQKVERADAYFHIIERVFAEEQVPDDLKFLVLQESGLISDAVSTSNAVGFWQFKKATGLEMGLRIDDDVDERMNIVASTRAAAKYFKRHNFYMKNWIYAVLCHYAGLSGARSIADPQYLGVDDMELDEKTHWYVMKYLSHKVAFENSIHRNPILPLKVLEYDNCEGKTLQQIANETNIDLEQIRFYNKWLKKEVVPSDKDYVVLLPVKSDEESNILAMMNKQPEPSETGTLQPWKEKTGIFGWVRGSKQPETTDAKSGDYISEAPIFFSWNGIKAIQARKGDNIAKLALQADIDKDDFLEYNDLRNFDLIVRGQVYYIKKKYKRAKVPFHTVKEGETLWEVSQNYGITMKSLLKKNRMDKPELLKAGRVLWLRRTRPESTPIEYEAVEPAPSVLPLPKKERSAADSMLAQKAINKPVVNNKPTSNNVSARNSGKISFMLPADSMRAVREAALADSILKADDVREQQEENSSDSVQIFVAGNKNKLVAQQPEKSEANIESAKPKIEKVIINTPPSQTKIEPQMPPLGFVMHKVEAGQTLFKVARIYNVKVDSLIEWNHFDGSPLKVGQLLSVRAEKAIISDVVTINTTSPQPDTTKIKEIPKTAVIVTPPAPKTEIKLQNTPITNAPTSTQEYVVKSGDTLFKIARENGVTVQQIKEWNNKNDANVSLGEKIILKK